MSDFPDMDRFRAAVAALTLEATVTDCNAQPCKAEPASGVWQAAVRNTFGDVVSALQVLNGIEKRLADVQTELAAVKAEVMTGSTEGR